MADSVAGIELPPGDPEAVSDAARGLRGAGSGFERTASTTRAAAASVDWKGIAALAFHQRCGDYGDAARQADGACVRAAGALSRFADRLRVGRERVRDLQEQAKDAQRRLKAAEAKAAQAAQRQRQADEQASDALLNAPLDPSPYSMAEHSRALSEASSQASARSHFAGIASHARGELERLRKRAHDEREHVRDAARRAAGEVRAAAAGLPRVVGAAGGAPGAAIKALSPPMLGADTWPEAPSLENMLKNVPPLVPPQLLHSGTPLLRPLSPAERTEIERAQLYGGARAVEKTYPIGDFQGRTDGEVRIALFIAAKETGLQFPKGRGRGDGRGFDPNASPNRSRVLFDFDFADDEVKVRSNPSCGSEGQLLTKAGCHDAKPIQTDDSGGKTHSQVKVDEREDGAINISYETSNSAMHGSLSRSTPQIDGDITLKPHGDGSFEIHHRGDGYPSREAYYFKAGRVTTLYQREDQGHFLNLIERPWGSADDHSPRVP